MVNYWCRLWGWEEMGGCGFVASWGFGVKVGALRCEALCLWNLGM